ncbi:MAG: DUF2867 domain-containing protein [Planctomycetota bacterium]
MAHVLVTGATGYIGGRLVPRLLAAGHRVRVLVRDADPITGRGWEREVEVVYGDLLKPETLSAAVAGVDAAYYLVHSMYGGADFAAKDREAAGNFVSALKAAAASATAWGEDERAGGLPHVVYLGGVEPKAAAKQAGEGTRSGHLRSRAEVGQVLAEGLDGRTTEFRAGPIIGSGSASFEMVRYLTERIPVMVTPRWVNNVVQPIAVRDVLAYLIGALDVGPSGVMDIGTDALSFKAMMREVARQRGHRRVIIPTPVLAPKLAARWVGLVTPIPNALAVPLVEGVVQDLVADTAKAEELFPEIRPIPYPTAVEYALAKIEHGDVETRWSGAAVELVTENSGGGIDKLIEDREGLARDQRTLRTDVAPEHVFSAVCAIGGERGWPAYGWAWWLRGVCDAAIGGPGLRRGRRDPEVLLEGEALDWWRVDVVEPPGEAGEHTAVGRGLLRLRAEMKVPGRAWLQWEVEQRDGEDFTRLKQTALFDPRGLPGTLYWYAMLPMHELIFPKMLRGIERWAREIADEAGGNAEPVAGQAVAAGASSSAA